MKCDICKEDKATLHEAVVSDGQGSLILLSVCMEDNCPSFCLKSIMGPFSLDIPPVKEVD